MGKQTRSRTPKTGAKVRAVLDNLDSPQGLGDAPIAVETPREVHHEFHHTGTHLEHTLAFDTGSLAAHQEASSTLMTELHLLGPSSLDRAVFCRQLATLIEVGIPLLKALKLLSVRTAHPAMAKAVQRLARRVEEGQSVADGMRKDEKIFSPMICNIVQVGEKGGILENSLIRLAQIMESRSEIKRKVFTAAMYPAAAVSVALAVIVLILVKAVPVFTSVYSEAGAELPGPTRFVIGVSHFISGWFYVWLPLLVAAIVGIVWYARRPGGKRALSWLSLNTPVISKISRKIAVARFSRTLGSLLSSGVPLIESISIAADTNENVLIGDALRSVHRGVEKGEKIARPLAKARVFPPLVVDMISIGEETGTLDRMLEKISDIYDADVDATLRGLATIIEPVLIVVLGGLVIFIALAVMLPYFNLVNVV